MKCEWRYTQYTYVIIVTATLGMEQNANFKSNLRARIQNSALNHSCSLDNNRHLLYHHDHGMKCSAKFEDEEEIQFSGQMGV